MSASEEPSRTSTMNSASSSKTCARVSNSRCIEATAVAASAIFFARGLAHGGFLPLAAAAPSGARRCSGESPWGGVPGLGASLGPAASASSAYSSSSSTTSIFLAIFTAASLRTPGAAASSGVIRRSSEARTAASAVCNAAISSLHSLSDAMRRWRDSSARAVCVSSLRRNRSFSSFSSVVSSTNAAAASAYSFSFAAASLAADASAAATASRTAASSRSGDTSPATLASASTLAVSLAAASRRSSRAAFSASATALSAASFAAVSALSAMRLASAAAFDAAASARAASAASRAFAALEAAQRARLRLRHHRLAAIWHVTIAIASRAATRRAMKPRNTLCTSIAARV
mmetsp:Transcript_8597/g.39037  ORF Transcript_8597/g.39037 Transcript_8597/m.39037 type:complete len:347 (-) Transcript_8597:2407-3447(-)